VRGGGGLVIMFILLKFESGMLFDYISGSYQLVALKIS